MQGILKFHHCDITETKTFCLLSSFCGMHFLHRFWMIYLGYFQRSCLSTFILYFVFWVNFGFYFCSWPFPGLLWFFSWFLFLLCFWNDYIFNVFSGAVCSVSWRLLERCLCGVRSRSQSKLHSALVPQFHDWFDQRISQTNLMPLSSSYFLLHHRNWYFAIN